MHPNMQFQGPGGINGRTMGQKNTGLHNTRGKFGTGWNTTVDFIGTQPPGIKIFQRAEPEILRDE